jgi:hypothetical protein
MIEELDLALKQLLTDEVLVKSNLTETKISFAQPNEEWRGQGQRLELNIYLYDIREDRKLRSNEQQLRRFPDGNIDKMKPRPRVSCAYVITAWNKAAVTNQVDREEQEHWLLSKVLRVLLNFPKLPEDYWPRSESGEEPPLPMISAQAGGLVEPGEFWSALNTAVRPSIHCVVTLTLDSKDWERERFPMVISKIMEYNEPDQPGVRQRVIQVGGRVIDTAVSPTGIAGVNVRIKEPNKSTITDSRGYYSISGIPFDGLEAAVSSTFIASAPGIEYTSVKRKIPAPASGDYNIPVLLKMKIRLEDEQNPSLVITGAVLTVGELSGAKAEVSGGFYRFYGLTAGHYTIVVKDYKGETYSYIGVELGVDLPTPDCSNIYIIKLARK